MPSANGQDRQARMLRLYQTASPTQQGLIICVLLGYALLVVSLDGVVVVAIVRGASRSLRYRNLGPRAGIGPVLCAAVAAGAIQAALARVFIRAVDSGRAAAWLESGERWLTASARGSVQREPAPDAD